jgi:DNA mismatch repair protein MutS2
VDAFTLERIEFDAIRRITRDYCSCALGKRLAENMTPSRNPETIRRWQQQTEEMVRALRDFGPAPFGGIADITDSLNRARPGGGADGEDYAAIASTLTGSANVKAHLVKLPEEMTELTSLADSLEAFDELLAAIARVVASDGTILDTASPKLGRIRRDIEETTRRIHDVIYGYLRNEKVAPLLQSANVTLHGDRYVLPVKAENRGRLPGVVHRSSNTGATVFVEPNASVELNNELADLAQDERREIQRLLNELGVKVQRKHEEIRTTLRTLAKIDLIGAKAQYAYQFEMTRPEMARHNELRLDQARHPLLLDQARRQDKQGLDPRQRHEVVPIDVRLGSDFDLLIITGSNTGGKTVTLKTVALLAVMAQAGMHIPARRGATLPVLRDILLDIGDEQSLEHSLSTFGGHVKRIRYILEKADKDCLVLIDELGAGTDPDEGGAIGQAILDQLRDVGCMGMVTTHLGVLKAYAYNHDRVDNASVEFDVKTLRPTYHLRIGTPGESHAITVAQQLGMPRKITSAAKEYIKSRGRQFKRAIRSTTKARESAEQARTDARLAELAAANQADLYESKLADLNRLREEFTTWLAQLPSLEPGDAVPVPSLRKTGRLVRLELHKQKALVDCDGVEVEVPIRDLMPSLGQNEARDQIAQLQNEIREQSHQARQKQAEAEKLQKEYRESLRMHKQRARQFDNWLGAIARLKVGDEVPMAIKPGKGKVVSVDLPGLKATVQTSAGEKTVSLQDLFPQTGPFAPEAKGEKTGRKRRKRPERSGAGDKRKAKGPAKPKPDRPMRRRDEGSRAAAKSRKAMENVQPGDQVFVIPFNKKATLIRLDAEKQQAVVQSGAFEMDLPLADLEPIRS